MALLTLQEWLDEHLANMPDRQSVAIIGALRESLAEQDQRITDLMTQRADLNDRIRRLEAARVDDPPGVEDFKRAIQEVLDRPDPRSCSCYDY